MIDKIADGLVCPESCKLRQPDRSSFTDVMSFLDVLKEIIHPLGLATGHSRMMQDLKTHVLLFPPDVSKVQGSDNGLN